MKFISLVVPALLLLVTLLLAGCGGGSSSSTTVYDTLIGTLEQNSSSNSSGTLTPLAGWKVALNSANSSVTAVTSSDGSFSLTFPTSDVSGTGNPLYLTPPAGYAGPLASTMTTIVGLSGSGNQELIVEVTINANGTVTVQ